MMQQITELDVKSRAVTFVNGHVEKDVDKFVFCTGYRYQYPFLDSLPGFEGGSGRGNTKTLEHIF